MDHYQRVIHRVILGCVMHTLTEMSNIWLSMPQSFVYVPVVCVFAKLRRGRERLNLSVLEKYKSKIESVIYMYNS